MAGLRKGKCYRHITRAYTRKSKFRKKSYIAAIPTIKIIKFDMGNVKKKFKYEVDLVSKGPIQLRHNALESSRMVVNRKLNEKLGDTNYHFKLKVYPHHVLRENKMLTGAHADRMQTGMQRAFGRAVGIAAQVKKGKTVFSIRVDKKDLETTKVILKTATPRLPGNYIIEVNQL